MALISHASPSAGRRINQERQAAIQGGFFWPAKSVAFDTDPASRALITDRVAKILAKTTLGEAMPDFSWRASDNSDHSFSPTEFLQFAVALDDWVESKLIESWQKKASL
tara:strand:- start:4739 stop:5065 length:327 start_codon:yes stop_codon:yes gene_type:complete